MTKKNLFMGAALLLAGAAQAGSAIAVTKCQSASGRTHVEILNQDMMQYLSIKFTIFDKDLLVPQTKTFTIDTDDGQDTIDSTGNNLIKFRDKVFVATAKKNGEAPADWIELWALPGTIRKVSGQDHSQKYQFKANIVGTDPRAEMNGEDSPLIEVNCVLDYSI